MPDSPDDKVQISDGQTSPQTSIDEEDTTLDIRNRLKHEFRPKWIRISRKLPISIPQALLAAFLYLTLLIALAATFTPYNAFGLLSATTGGILLTLIRHPAGNVRANTSYQRFIYHAVALTFLTIGIWYMLIGIVRPVPF